MSDAFTCFGELLIRLTTAGRDPLYSLPELTPYVGGAEANVGVGLTRLGHDVRMISVVPDNDLGQAALGNLRYWGVDTSRVKVLPEGRMGLYFLTTGGIHRPSDILYDRAGSAFAEADFAAFDWAQLLEGSGWLHVSGITAALGQNAFEGALKAMKMARTLGVKVSFDCNYRPKLWEAWGGDAPTLIKQLMAQSDLIFGGYRDIELVFGVVFTGEAGSHERNRAAADHAFAAFPDLKRLISTRREQVNVDHNRLAGLMFTREASLETKTYDIARIIDRIGGGDAFAAGVLHGILSGKTDQEALDLGIAGGCLKHAMPGDFALATPAELEAFLSEDGFDVKR
ncbi:sugar kinase [Asticcacaulis tiandongensis]|uniref:sugar kinase n=1 Tax=Asticcacaulis tiandongensis TaxID=2565365 RepID=UPI00112D48BD|nr:sugar kinase [Asticcacaulis tiandongensis]